MNPIENVWKIIGEKAQNRNPQNIDDLWGFLKEQWESITTAFCKKLFGSCGQRCNEVNSLNIEFFFSLYIDLTKIYDTFFNFWPRQNLYFCFFSWLLIYCKENLENFICNKCICVPCIFWLDSLTLLRFCFVLWRIKHCRLFNSRSFLYIHIRYRISKHYFVDSIFKRV